MASLNEANGPARKRNGELSLDQRSSIIYAYLNGCTTQTKLANDFGCTRKTIYNTIKRFQHHQTVESRPRTGRPRKYNDRTRKFIYLQARRNPFYTYKKLSTVIPGHPSRTTILTTLKAYGIRKYRTKLKIPIERSLARRRYRFIQKWKGVWSGNGIRNWMFSDECSVERTSNCGPQWCWRFISEGYRRELVNAKVHVKDIAQMVWGAVWLGGRSPLVVMKREKEINPSSIKRGYSAISYIAALEEGLIQDYKPGYIFQQDNARIHTAKLTQEWFETHGVHVEEWPPHSPDLNPIEPVWRRLKLKLFELFPELMHMGRSEEDWKVFKRCIKVAWMAIPQEQIDRLILSMGRRCEAVRKVKGYYTKY